MRILLQAFFFSLFIFNTICCFADTNIGGIINNNTSLTLAQSPYNLTADLQVPEGVTLTIEPGVSIKYSNNYQIYVRGNIIANGTQQQPISFSGSAATYPGTTFFKFEGADLSLSQISYVRMENSFMAIRVGEEYEHNQKPKNTGILKIDQAAFLNTEIRTAGYHTTAKLEISNSTFTSATISGQYPQSEPIEIRKCTITGSKIVSDSYNKGIFLYESTINNSELIIGCCGANINVIKSVCKNSKFKESNDYTTLSFQDSKIYDCEINTPNSAATIERSIIRSNFSPLAKMKTATISNSTFIGNGKGIGLLFTHNQGMATTISSSTFSNNQTAISYTGTVQFNYPIVFTKNNFINNSLYNIENKTLKTIHASGNYWGSTDPEEINNKIFDSKDNLNYGLVDLSNPLANPGAGMTPVKEVTKEAISGGVRLSWKTNPESNLKGYKVYYGSQSAYTFASVADAGQVLTFTVAGADLNQDFAVTAYNTNATGTEDQVAGNESWFSHATAPATLASFNAVCINVPSFALSGGFPAGGIYSGKGVDASGRFNAQTAGPGEHPITYSVTDAYGNVSSATGKITVLGLSPLTIIASQPAICPGEQVQLSVSGGSTYTWLTANGLTDLTASNPQVSPTVTTTYSVSSLINGCTVTATITIQVNSISNFTAGNTQNVCINTNAFTLTGMNPLGGIWSGSGVNSNGLFNPATAGEGPKTLTYTVNQNGCTFSKTKTINVTGSPAIPGASSGSSQLCPGQIATFSIAPVAGATGYSWSLPAGFSILSGYSGTSLQVRAGSNSGVVGVAAIGTCGVSAASTLHLTVTPPPLVDAGTNESICGSAPAFSLSGFSPAGGTWSGPGVTAAGLFSPALAGTGTKVLTYTVNQNGCTVSSSKTIQVKAAPASPYFLSGVSNTCKGKTNLVFAVNPVSDVSGYTWTVPEGFLITSGQGTNTLTVTAGDQSGFITVVAHSICGGSSPPRNLYVSVFAPPSVFFPALNSTCLSAEAFVLNSAVPAGGVYVGPGIRNNVFTPSEAGTGAHIIYYVYTNAMGCTSSEPQTIRVYDCEASLAEAASVYPNPTAGANINISMPVQGTSNFKVQILNNQGKVVLEKNYDQVSNEFRKSFNLSSQAKGIYLLKITTGSTQFTKRVILN